MIIIGFGGHLHTIEYPYSQSLPTLNRVAGRLSFFMSGADRVQMVHQNMVNVENIDSWYPDLWNK